jgi:hypothetical protein
MSEVEKDKRGKRLMNEDRYIKRQLRIARTNRVPVKEAHRFHKQNSMTCGNADCVMCGNPRKTFKELTLQEKSFIETEDWKE